MKEEALDSDDIEILEVVGLNDDAPPPSDRDLDEVEVSFDAEEDRIEVEEMTSARTARVERAAAPPAAITEIEEPMRERFRRLQADFENFKKRMDREKEDYHRHATAALVAKLLPVIDNFERALAIDPRSEGESAMLKGIALIHRQLMEELKREGLVPLESVGEPFDPSRHEAIATDSTSQLPPNTVIAEVQRGYFFMDRLLRPAAVKVSVDHSHPESANGEES
jgi:molecular chaperone GrpE